MGIELIARLSLEVGVSWGLVNFSYLLKNLMHRCFHLDIFLTLITRWAILKVLCGGSWRYVCLERNVFDMPSFKFYLTFVNICFLCQARPASRNDRRTEHIPHDKSS